MASYSSEARGPLRRFGRLLGVLLLVLVIVALVLVTFPGRAGGPGATVLAPGGAPGLPNPAVALLTSSPMATTTRQPSTPGPTSLPTEVIRTPFPTSHLPTVTPIPTTGYPFSTITPGSPPTPPPGPTNDPQAPFSMIMIGHPVDAQTMIQRASLIVIGTVNQVEPARWTTPDGLRPANPHVQPAGIYVPVHLNIEQVIKGVTDQTHLLLYAGGGTIGQDSINWRPDIFTFRVGERVVIVSGRAFQVNNRQFWGIVDRYTVTSDGRAVNYRTNRPLQELLDEIRRIVVP
jgi:hypothetical protein